jgi:hypothetical protein
MIRRVIQQGLAGEQGLNDLLLGWMGPGVDLLGWNDWH